MTYALCYGHQIVYIPTSIPTPVYVAEASLRKITYYILFLQEYAKRGRNIYNKWISENGNGMNHANVKEYGDLMKILGLMIFAGLQLLCIGYFFRAPICRKP